MTNEVPRPTEASKIHGGQVSPPKAQAAALPTVDAAQSDQVKKPTEHVKVGKDFTKRLLSGLKFGGGFLLLGPSALGIVLTSPLILVGGGIGYGVVNLLQKAGVSVREDSGVAGGAILGSLGSLAVFGLGMKLIASSLKEKS